MKQISTFTALLMAAGLAGCGGSSTTNSDFASVDIEQPVSDWQLVWSDEFDGDSIDNSKWTHEINCSGGGNNEQQCYTDSADNSFVADGNLHIVALPAEDDAPLPYTSARLNTKFQGDFKYGRFEMRAKLPQGQGSWPAFWMLPTDEVYGGWPKSGEIDIMEAVNLKVADADGNEEARVHGTLHYGRDWPDNSSTGKEYSLPDGANPADDFHTYAIEWQEGEIRWYVDGYLFQTQMASEVRYNNKDQAAGLIHRGWFSEYFDIATGELETHWDASPFDQRFHLLLNLAVGGNWPSNVNNTGIDAAAFAEGQSYIIDYVRVYQCSLNPETGKGCETVRQGYKDEETLSIGAAPIPVAPSGVAQNLTIFADEANPAWPAWDCCGGTTPTVETDDAEHGAVVEFVIGATPTVMGFSTLQAGTPAPFDASPMLTTGSVSFDMKLVTAPANPASVFKFKIESGGASTAVEIDLSSGNGGQEPVVGEWATYTFSLQSLADAGLDLSAIDVLMIFPAWDTGNGAVYRLDNVEISQPLPSLVLFEDQANVDWPMWDCCGGTVPTEEMDDADHGLTAQFVIGATPTVMGFKPADGSGIQFDASSLLTEGAVQFDMKLVTAPANPASVFKFKIEANGASSAVEVDLSSGNGGLEPVVGEWATYTFSLQTLSDAGLDLSAIDVIMVFPAWDTGNGAVYRIDNAKISAL
ncbi:family 16 glycosylhydrolase [Rheinheimera sp. NSM]|uniref:family 16 glycosylhydrolase n=1 Tax=Rheinheimera sp. NSM TaxID=3457884 RepID=UPI0040373E0D